MPRGELACRCGEGKAVLHVQVQGQRVGFLCDACVSHSPTLRAFLVACGWLYGWPQLHFRFANRAATEPGFRTYLETVIRHESDRADGGRRDRLRRRIAWAAGDPRSQRAREVG